MLIMLNPPCTLYKFLTVNAAMPVIQASRTFIFHRIYVKKKGWSHNLKMIFVAPKRGVTK